MLLLSFHVSYIVIMSRRLRSSVAATPCAFLGATKRTNLFVNMLLAPFLFEEDLAQLNGVCKSINLAMNVPSTQSNALELDYHVIQRGRTLWRSLMVALSEVMESDQDACFVDWLEASARGRGFHFLLGRRGVEDTYQLTLNLMHPSFGARMPRHGGAQREERKKQRKTRLYVLPSAFQTRLRRLAMCDLPVNGMTRLGPVEASSVYWSVVSGAV